MPGKVKVKIISGRNLPVMDRSSDTTDAYVEIKLGTTTYKTDVCRKSLHPQWNSEWYRFEVDDSELQDEPLQIRLMDHDTYSANDSIGKVYLDMNPLLLSTAGSLIKYCDTNTNHERSSNSVMSGWIPVYDTMHGIRGEVNIIVKVELFSDFNRFRQSSCGIQFFFSRSIPQGYFAQIVHGFVEELVVNDDPEYQWIDKIRTPRASNEARQTLFFKLSGELQRKIGLKALDLGGNSVIGYRQCFDLEGESGIVARGIGTAVTLVKLNDIPLANIAENGNEERALNYLKFLGSDITFRLNAASSKSHFFPKKLTPTLPLPTDIDHLVNSKYSRRIAKHLTNTNLQHNYYSKSNPSLADHIHRPIKTLLKQEEQRGVPGHGISQKIKNLKYSSQSILSKKMTDLRAKLGSNNLGGISDNISDNESETSRRYKNKNNIDSSVMAELLARSVIHAHNSLSSILEIQDSPPKHDNSDTKSICESLTDDNVLLINEATSEPYNISVQSSSLDNQSSNNSSSFNSSSSSDLDEDESFNGNEIIDFETVSNIVKNVELLEKNLSHKNKFLSKQLSLPTIPYNYDNVVELTLLESLPSNSQTIENDDTKQELKEYFEEQEQMPLFKETVFKQAPIAELESDLLDDEICDSKVEQNRRPPKLIIPPVMMVNAADNNNSKNLVKTAMQTMLLEKVNIMGTYTPPTSPTLSDKNTTMFNIDSPTISQQSQSSSPNNILTTPKESQIFSKSNNNMSISTPDNSLFKYDSSSSNNKHDTVLGMPFTSWSNVNIKRQSSHPCLSSTVKSNLNDHQAMFCFSDSELHKPTTKSRFNNLFKKNSIKNSSKIIDNNDKNRKAFVNLVGKFNDINHQENGSDLHRRRSTHEHLHRKRFSFLRLNRRKSHLDLGVEKSESTPDVFHQKSHKSMFGLNIFNKNKKTDTNTINKKQGLVGTALGNVVMETVQDILVTSHIDEIPKKQNDPYIEPPIVPQIEVILTNTNNLNNNSNNIGINIASDNTEIDQDVSNNNNNNNLHASLSPAPRNSTQGIEAQPNYQAHHRTESVGTKIAHSPAKLYNIPCIHRRSSDSDLSITPKGNSLTGSDRSCGSHFMKSNIVLRSALAQDNFDMLEYPFLTMSTYPPGFVQQLGGAVNARSVKLLERISNLEEPESRDTWWSEIRMEIRSHARALNCNAVLGYTETTSICEDVCVLSASGTAAVIGFQYTGEISDNITGLPIITKTHIIGKDNIMTSSLDRSDFEKEKVLQKTDIKNIKPLYESPEHDLLNGQLSNVSCTLCHLPFSSNNVPIRSVTLKCGSCQSGNVPDVLIATIEIPDGIPIIGRGCFLQSYVCRNLKDLRGESNAKEISDGLPFLEYELHRLLLNKLKVKCMNAIFGLKIHISIGEKMLMGIATGTAVFLTPLPPPVLPKLVSDRTSDVKKLADLQKHLHDTVKRNREIYQIKIAEENQVNRGTSDNDDSEDEITSVDLLMGNKDCCILEVDDPEDAEVLNLIMEERPPDGFHVVNTEFVPGLEELEIVKNLQMFKQIYRAKLYPPPFNFDVHFRRLLQSIYFKLRRMVPCALCDLEFRIDLPEPDEIQLCVLGMALGLGDPQKVKVKQRKTVMTKRTDDDMIFNLEEDQIPENSIPNTSTAQSFLNTHSTKFRQKSPIRNRLQTVKQRHMPYRERHGVDITPLSYIPGGKIERYLGNLNFFFIRETTSIREEGGLSGFIHSFVTEVLAIVRAHVTALGGNAMVAYFLTECVLNYNLHKNQGQCLINVGGDVVFVSYFNDDS